ncbi:hypothetical protein N9L68_05980 [bacterium]|nr:hypothetical protein [bacterium]
MVRDDLKSVKLIEWLLCTEKTVPHLRTRDLATHDRGRCWKAPNASSGRSSTLDALVDVPDPLGRARASGGIDVSCFRSPESYRRRVVDCGGHRSLFFYRKGICRARPHGGPPSHHW